MSSEAVAVPVAAGAQASPDATAEGVAADPAVTKAEPIADAEVLEETPASGAEAAIPEDTSMAEVGKAEGDKKRGRDEAGSEPPAPAAKVAKREGPMKLGYRTFSSSKEGVEFFKKLLLTWPRGVDFNEYEHLALLDLLKEGHPQWQGKVGPGVRAFQVRRWGDGNDENSKALHVVRSDGTSEDFSYIKCLSHLFPGEVSLGSSGRGPGRGKAASGGGASGGGAGRSGGDRGGRGSRGRRGRGRR